MEDRAAAAIQTRSKRIAWLDERLGLAEIREFIAHKTNPKHSATMWYYFGGITLFLFVIQVLTGILLLLYYRPTPTEAYESVQFIMTRVEFGWLVRSVHSWAANLMILTAFIHMFSVVGDADGQPVGAEPAAFFR
jgi:cytochrome b6